MREILYFQAGTFSNYVSTHFWNTQDAYLAREITETTTEFSIDEKVSFTERKGPDGMITLYPRVVIFDGKDNFGALAESNASTGNEEPQESESDAILWEQPIDEFRQRRITKSDYHLLVEEPPSLHPREVVSQKTVGAHYPGNIRYWSDYSHVYYLPRSIQRLPNSFDSNSPPGNWKESQEQFLRYNEDHDVMDSSVRLFLEESDTLQGIQLTNDVSSFGGFSDALLTHLRDEYSKIPTIVYAFLSSINVRNVDVDNDQGVRHIINQALYMRSLTDNASLGIPLNVPSLWPDNVWPSIDFPKSTYATSSIVAAHLESTSLAFRMKDTQESISVLATQLFGDGFPHLAELSGILSVATDIDWESFLANFSTEKESKQNLFCVKDTIRGFTPSIVANYYQWLSNFRNQGVTATTFQTPGYPLLNPLRNILTLQDPRDVKVLSRLSVSQALPSMMEEYAVLVDTSLKKRSKGVLSMEIEIDDLHELVHDLWAIHDSWPVDENDSSADAPYGTDED